MIGCCRVMLMTQVDQLSWQLTPWNSCWLQLVALLLLCPRTPRHHLEMFSTQLLMSWRSLCVWWRQPGLQLLTLWILTTGLTWHRYLPQVLFTQSYCQLMLTVQVAKAASMSLNNCMNCLPGLREVDQIVKYVTTINVKLSSATQVRCLCTQLRSVLMFMQFNIDVLMGHSSKTMQIWSTETDLTIRRMAEAECF